LFLYDTLSGIRGQLIYERDHIQSSVTGGEYVELRCRLKLYRYNLVTGGVTTRIVAYGLHDRV
jgi:hypothetical protein